jgi:hypothetical protein
MGSLPGGEKPCPTLLEKMTPEQRHEIAKKAAQARWAKQKADKTVERKGP